MYNEGKLSTAEKARVDGTVNALIEYHTYMLAFEMAGAVQGGGDSRTISDKDVKIMRAAIRDKFVSSGQDFVSVLKEIRQELSGILNMNRLWTNASRTRSIKGLKAASLYEALYMDIQGSDNPLRAFARKWTKQSPEQLLEDHGDDTFEKNTEELKKTEEEKTVPAIPFSNYTNGLKDFATGLQQIVDKYKKDGKDIATAVTWPTYKKQAELAIKAGYTREHFITLLGDDITTKLFTPSISP